MNVLQAPTHPTFFHPHETPHYNSVSPSHTMSVRKRKADDDGHDENMLSPHGSPAVTHRTLARPTKRTRGNEISGRPLALPRLLETLDAQSLRSVLQTICERHPDIGSEVVASAPRPSVPAALDVLAQYQERLREAFPFGGNNRSDYAYNRVKQALISLIDALTDYTPHYLPPNESQTSTSLSYLDNATKIIHDLPDWDSHPHKFHKDNAYDEISRAWALVISEASKRGGGFQLHSGGWDEALAKHNEQSGGKMQLAVNALGSNLDWMGGSSGGASDPISIRNQLLSGTYGSNLPVRAGCLPIRRASATTERCQTTTKFLAKFVLLDELYDTIMPAPGDQHLESGGRQVINPFEEVKPRISEYTAVEIASISSRLEKQLGPEYISSRSGPGGQKVHYVAAEKCIQLANEVFGFNGWSSQIKDVQVDFVDENTQTMKVSLGLSVIVRVTLRDGTFHEDIGYGHIENAKGKAAAFEKAKKEGTTDALKRALRNFGNVLGNCIYDKDYLAKVVKIKNIPKRWDENNLHRHVDCAPIKIEARKTDEEKPQALSLISEDTLEDEFGEFDEADFSVADAETHPDEVVLPPQPSNASNVSNHSGGNRGGSGPNTNNFASNKHGSLSNHQQAMRPSNGAQPLRNTNNITPQPQTPKSGPLRTHGGPDGSMRPPAGNPGHQPAPQNKALPEGRSLNQPLRAVDRPISNLASPTKQTPAQVNSPDNIPQEPQGPGFFSARAAVSLPESSTSDPLPAHLADLPAFNPHSESPSIKRTPGIDHKSSKPLTRSLKHVAPILEGQVNMTGPRNVVNPQLDAARRIGAPGFGAAGGSPMGNRGSYKPPTMMKRPIDTSGGNSNIANRAPLVDLPANGTIGGGGDSGDVKRQRIN